MRDRRIYLDHASTTPLGKRVADAMTSFQSEFYGNPNSIHQEGQQARAKIDFAREEIAKSIFAKPQDLVFTSGATEANNTAIKGVVSYQLQKMNEKPHVITTLLEHQSVYNTVKSLEEHGIIQATYVKPSRDGLVTAEEVIREIRSNTILISAIFVSNEIGTVLPIREIGRLLAEHNKQHQTHVLLHTDAVQAYKHYNCHVDKLGVDLMTLSAHKISGPKGIGALYVRPNTPLDKLMEGGSQEYGLRPGTQNIVGIIGFSEAVKMLGDFETKSADGMEIRKIADQLIDDLRKMDNVEMNGPRGEDRAPDNINFTIKGADQETVIARLDLAGYAVSTGSACVSGTTEPSHVILALGNDYPDPSATVRVSLGRLNTADELRNFAHQVKKLVKS